MVIPNYFSPDGQRKSIRHVREFFDHFGAYITFGKQQKGDLVCFSWKGLYPQHIGIMINEEDYVHAHTRDGEVKKNKIFQRPVNNPVENAIYLVNPIGFKRPAARL